MERDDTGADDFISNAAAKFVFPDVVEGDVASWFDPLLVEGRYRVAQRHTDTHTAQCPVICENWLDWPEREQ